MMLSDAEEAIIISEVRAIHFHHIHSFSVSSYFHIHWRNKVVAARGNDEFIVMNLAAIPEGDDLVLFINGRSFHRQDLLHFVLFIPFFFYHIELIFRKLSTEAFSQLGTKISSFFFSSCNDDSPVWILLPYFTRCEVPCWSITYYKIDFSIFLIYRHDFLLEVDAYLLHFHEHDYSTGFSGHALNGASSSQIIALMRMNIN